MTYFSTPFGSQPNELPIEADRYRLIWAAPCPYASRAKIALDLLGLDKIISVGEVHPVNKEYWNFSLDLNQKDSVLDVKDIRELYLQSEPNYEGPYTVPALADIQTKKVVRKESAEIVRDFVVKFKEFHAPGAPDLYPIDLHDVIDKENHIAGNLLQDKLYMIKNADTQKKYDRVSANYFKHIANLDQRLAENRYYHGNKLTETDIFLYVNLVRFAHVFYFLFDATEHQLEEFPNLWGYLVELYQIPAFGNNTDWDKIKTGNYLGKNYQESKTRPIVPAGPSIERWNQPHGRDNI